METSFHFCEGFHFPSNSNTVLSLRIQNHEWVVGKKLGQSVYDNYSGNYKRQLFIQLQRFFCTEVVNVLLIMFKQPDSACSNWDNWEKYSKSVTFHKNQKKIEISFCELTQYDTSCQIGNLMGLISVTSLDSCKTDDKKSNVESTLSSAVISSQLSKDFVSLLDSDISSDYDLRCAGQEFHVHKCILAARSSVFATMFRFHNKIEEARESMTNSETKANEKQKPAQDCTQDTSTVSNQTEDNEDIMDMKPEILKKMLKYIYSGQIDDLTSSEAGDLLYAADKYQLALLKEICVQKLKSTLSASNVLDILVLGDLHDQSLKAHAMDFICKYPSLSELKKMDQWKSLQTTNPTMIIEVLTSVVGYLQDSNK